MICDESAFFAKDSADSATERGDRLLIMNISGSAPASSSTLAVSYSQLVPGNTGISTFGLEIPIFGATRVTALCVNAGISRFSCTILQGYTLSSLPSHTACTSSSDTASSPRVKLRVSDTVPTGIPTESASGESSSRNDPYEVPKSKRSGYAGSKSNPNPLPTAIFITASAVPPPTGVQADTAFPERSRPVTCEYSFLSESALGSPSEPYSGIR